MSGRASAATGRPVLLLGHFDTVWPLGTLERMPLRRDGSPALRAGHVRHESGDRDRDRSRIQRAAQPPARGILPS